MSFLALIFWQLQAEADCRTLHVLATGTSGETVPDIQASQQFTLVILMQQTSGIAESEIDPFSLLEGSYGEPS